jgi:hypothetical protein
MLRTDDAAKAIAILDKGNLFADGMAYVALSRVRSLDGLTLKSWSPKCVSASKDALEVYGRSK